MPCANCNIIFPFSFQFGSRYAYQYVRIAECNAWYMDDWRHLTKSIGLEPGTTDESRRWFDRIKGLFFMSHYLPNNWVTKAQVRLVAQKTFRRDLFAADGRHPPIFGIANGMYFIAPDDWNHIDHCPHLKLKKPNWFHDLEIDESRSRPGRNADTMPVPFFFFFAMAVECCQEAYSLLAEMMADPAFGPNNDRGYMERATSIIGIMEGLVTFFLPWR